VRCDCYANRLSLNSRLLCSLFTQEKVSCTHLCSSALGGANAMSTTKADMEHAADHIDGAFATSRASVWSVDIPDNARGSKPRLREEFGKLLTSPLGRLAAELRAKHSDVNPYSNFTPFAFFQGVLLTDVRERRRKHANES
jgi:hypothetical protein